MKERFEYYVLNNRLFVYDTSSTFIVYWQDDDWYEECSVQYDALKEATKINEKEALEKTNGSHPLKYVEELIEQDMYKNIYCP